MPSSERKLNEIPDKELKIMSSGMLKTKTKNKKYKQIADK